MNRATSSSWWTLILPTFACSAAVVALAPSAFAEGRVLPLEIQDAVWALDLQVQGVMAAFSPDSQLVASVVCDPRRRVATDDKASGKEKTRRSGLTVGCDVWLTPAGGGPSRNLTAAKGNSFGPSWSPDGRLLAFTSDRDGKPRLWLWDRKADTFRVLWGATTRTWLGYETPVWTPDGRALVVKATPEGVSEEELELGFGRGGSEVKDKEPGSTLVLFRSPPPSPADKGAATGFQGAKHLFCDLAIVDIATGKSRPLLRRVHPAAYRLSPDGRELAYMDVRGPGPADFAAFSQSIAVVELATGRTRDLVDGVLQSFPGAMSWSPDGKWLAYTATTPKKSTVTRITDVTGESGGGELYVVPAAGGEARVFKGAPEAILSTDFTPPRWDARSEHVYVVGKDRVWKATPATMAVEALTAETPYEVREIVASASDNRYWTQDEGRSLFVCTREKTSRKAGFARVDTQTGRMEPVLEQDKRIGVLFDGPVTSPDGRWVAYTAQSATESQDVWIAGAGFSAPHRLTTINRQLDKYVFGAARLIDFHSLDGEPLRASLLLPAGYEAGKRYPTVVWVYASDSGSRAVDHFGLVGISAYNMHMLTTRGYAVMWPDIPTHVGSPMQDLMKAVMPAVDKLVELGIADPDRLAVMGQSNGGYSTLSLVVQTTRFKAAVMNAGFGDLVGFYGSMSYAGTGSWIPWLERMGGSMGAAPWEVPLRYVENSPVFYLDRIKTPIIVQAGGDDEAIVQFSDQVWVGLQRLGKDATYLRYSQEEHVLTKAANLVDYWKRVIAFFDEKVKGAKTASGS